MNTTLSYGSRGQPRKFIGPKNTLVCNSKRCRLLLNNWNRNDDKNNNKKHQRNPILLILSISTINFQGPNDKNPPTEVPPGLQWEHTALQSTNDALNLSGPDWIARYPWWLGPGIPWLERAYGLLTLGGIPRISNQTKSPNNINCPKDPGCRFFQPLPVYPFLFNEVVLYSWNWLWRHSVPLQSQLENMETNKKVILCFTPYSQF